jgi:DNA-binding beta-propeller fold protein YncE
MRTESGIRNPESGRGFRPRPPRGRGIPGILALILAGCGASGGEDPAVRVIGGGGVSPGRFTLPRAAAWDPAGHLYVVDKSGRVQCFDASGAYERGWSTPAVEKGRPAGIAWDPKGTVLVADTHYHRILRYTPEGKLVAEFGAEGKGPGQFIYPTGLALAADGTIFVSEFGGNDRIQVFTPEGKFVRGWGRYGEGEGEFKRPQGITLRGDRLYVADAANHRIQVFTPEGTFVRAWGGMKYPYGVSVDDQGNVLAAEYGSHRISKFSPEGELLAHAGQAGAEAGDLNTPWGVVAAGRSLYVVDSGNHRIQLWPAERLRPRSPAASADGGRRRGS